MELLGCDNGTCDPADPADPYDPTDKSAVTAEEATANNNNGILFLQLGGDNGNGGGRSDHNYYLTSSSSSSSFSSSSSSHHHQYHHQYQHQHHHCSSSNEEKMKISKKPSSILRRQQLLLTKEGSLSSLPSSWMLLDNNKSNNNNRRSSSLPPTTTNNARCRGNHCNNKEGGNAIRIPKDGRSEPQPRPQKLERNRLLSSSSSYSSSWGRGRRNDGMDGSHNEFTSSSNETNSNPKEEEENRTRRRPTPLCRPQQSQWQSQQHQYQYQYQSQQHPLLTPQHPSSGTGGGAAALEHQEDQDQEDETLLDSNNNKSSSSSIFANNNRCTLFRRTSWGRNEEMDCSHSVMGGRNNSDTKQQQQHPKQLNQHQLQVWSSRHHPQSGPVVEEKMEQQKKQQEFFAESKIIGNNCNAFGNGNSCRTGKRRNGERNYWYSNNSGSGSAGQQLQLTQEQLRLWTTTAATTETGQGEKKKESKNIIVGNNLCALSSAGNSRRRSIEMDCSHSSSNDNKSGDRRRKSPSLCNGRAQHPQQLTQKLLQQWTTGTAAAEVVEPQQQEDGGGDCESKRNCRSNSGPFSSNNSVNDEMDCWHSSGNNNNNGRRRQPQHLTQPQLRLWSSQDPHPIPEVASAAPPSIQPSMASSLSQKYHQQRHSPASSSPLDNNFECGGGDDDDDDSGDYNSFCDSSTCSSSNLDEASFHSSTSLTQSPGAAATMDKKSMTTTRQRHFPKRVRFDSVEVREYSVTVGDHPCCPDSCPLTLEWSWAQESSAPVQLAHHEAIRFMERSQSSTEYQYGRRGPRRLSRAERRERVLRVQGLTKNKHNNKAGGIRKPVLTRSSTEPASPKRSPALSAASLPAVSKYQRYYDDADIKDMLRLEEEQHGCSTLGGNGCIWDYDAIHRLEVHMELVQAQQNTEDVRAAWHRVHKELECELPAAIAAIRLASPSSTEKDYHKDMELVKKSLATVNQEITKVVASSTRSSSFPVASSLSHLSLSPLTLADQEQEGDMKGVQLALERVHEEMLLSKFRKVSAARGNNLIRKPVLTRSSTEPAPPTTTPQTTQRPAAALRPPVATKKKQQRCYDDGDIKDMLRLEKEQEEGNMALIDENLQSIHAGLLQRVHLEIQDASHKIVSSPTKTRTQESQEATRRTLSMMVHHELNEQDATTISPPISPTTLLLSPTEEEKTRYSRRTLFDPVEMETVCKALSGVQEEMEAAPLILARHGGFNKPEMKRVSKVLSSVQNEQIEHVKPPQKQQEQLRITKRTQPTFITSWSSRDGITAKRETGANQALQL